MLCKVDMVIVYDLLMGHCNSYSYDWFASTFNQLDNISSIYLKNTDDYMYNTSTIYVCIKIDSHFEIGTE